MGLDAWADQARWEIWRQVLGRLAVVARKRRRLEALDVALW
jgi:hypothetical protein